MRPDLFRVQRPGTGGFLATMARPRGGDWLDDEMTGLAAAGIAAIASLLTSAEEAERGLTKEAESAAVAGVAFRRLPTPDRQVPDRAGCMALAEELRGLLAAGQGVAVHCLNGIGRRQSSLPRSWCWRALGRRTPGSSSPPPTAFPFPTPAPSATSSSAWPEPGPGLPTIT